MNPTYYALAGFAGWTLLLTLVMATNRMANLFAGAKIPINKFSPPARTCPASATA